MKMKKNSFIVLIIFISLFTIACNKESVEKQKEDYTKEYTENNIEESNENNNNENIKENNTDNLKDDYNENTKEYGDNNDVVVKDIEDNVKEIPKTDNKMELFKMTTFNTVPEVCEYNLSKLDVTKIVQPTKIIGNHSQYIRKSEENICIDIVMSIKNLKNETKIAEDIMTAKVRINGKYYSTFSLVENLDGSKFEETTRIKSLETRNVHYIAEIPLKEYSEKIDIVVTIDGKNFYNEFDSKGDTF